MCALVGDAIGLILLRWIAKRSECIRSYLNGAKDIEDEQRPPTSPSSRTGVQEAQAASEDVVPLVA